MGSDMFWWGFYAARRRRLRRKHQQEMAAMEARLRTEMGLPATAPASTVQVIRPQGTHPRRELHLGRWLGCGLALVVLLLVLAFLVYLAIYGVQHGYIYPAHH